MYMTYVYVSSDLKVLVGYLHKSGRCIYIQGFAKVPR